MNKVRQFAVLTVVAVVGLFAAGYMLLVKPKASDVSELNATRASQESTNKKLEGQIKQLQDQAKKLPAVQAELAAIGKQLPANPELPALIRAVTAAADDAGLLLDALKPQPPQLYGGVSGPGGTTSSATAAGTTAAGTTAAGATGAAGGTDQLAMVPVEFKIYGGYHNMQLFFANLENLPRSFVLHKFSIKEIKGDKTKHKPGYVEATLNGRVFMTVPASSLPAPAAAAKTAPKS